MKFEVRLNMGADEQHDTRTVFECYHIEADNAQAAIDMAHRDLRQHAMWDTDWNELSIKVRQVRGTF